MKVYETRAIIIAAGEATRWGNYLGVPKHFIEIDGEPIIKRTVRLLKENGIEDIRIVANDNRYAIHGTQLYKPHKNKDNGDMDKFLNSRPLWLPGGRTLVVYGDVYFTELAMKTIVHDKREHFVLHARPFNSMYTGTPWGECFAVSFCHQWYEKVEKWMYRIVELDLPKKGGWELYRASLENLIPHKMMSQHWVTGHNFNAINDWTDDFDYPEDYDRFMELRGQNNA